MKKPKMLMAKKRTKRKKVKLLLSPLKRNLMLLRRPRKTQQQNREMKARRLKNLRKQRRSLKKLKSN